MSQAFGPESLRISLYERARQLYDGYLREHSIAFPDLTAADLHHARVDPGLQEAELAYQEATQLTVEQHMYRDLVTVLGQLGMLCHRQGRFKDAQVYFEECLALTASLPVDSESGISLCHYHLGVMAWRAGHNPQARQHLDFAMRLDQLTQDISGQLLIQNVLDRCPPSPISPRHPLRIPIVNLRRFTWLQLPPGSFFTGLPPIPELPDPGATATTPQPEEPPPSLFIASTSLVVWVLSYEEHANNTVADTLEQYLGQQGHRCTLQQAASGAPAPEQRQLPSLNADQILCGAVLVINAVGLADPLFRDWISLGIVQVAQRSDFRLFVCLQDVTAIQLQQLADRGDTLVQRLLDTVQMPTDPVPVVGPLPFLQSIEHVCRLLGAYLPLARNYRLIAWYRKLQFYTSSFMGSLASWTQLASILSTIFVLVVMFFMPRETYLVQWLVQYHPPFLFLAGVVLAPMAILPLYFLGRGVLAGNKLLAEQHSTLFIGCMIGTFLVICIPPKLEVPWSWMLLGCVVGWLLDHLRRERVSLLGKQFRLDQILRCCEDPRLIPAYVEALARGPLHPLLCPLFSPVIPRVFLSYSRRSEWSCLLGWALYQRMSQQGTEVFFDLPCIQAGSSWRGELHDHLAEATVFILLVDAATVDREWVATEIMTVLLRRAENSYPQVLILYHPTTRFSATRPLPVFQAILGSEPLFGEGQARMLPVSPITVPAVGDFVRPNRPQQIGLIPNPLRSFLNLASMPSAIWGTIVPILGIPALIFGLLELWKKYQISDIFVGWELLAPMFLILGYSLGFVLRLGVESIFQFRTTQMNPGFTMLLCAFGFFTLLSAWSPLVDALTIGWAATVVMLGWFISGSFLARSRRAWRDLFFSEYQPQN